jgi:hypothetical protein
VLLVCVALLSVFLIRNTSLGQSAATKRLLDLIEKADRDSAEELPRAAIDAGPPAIPDLRAAVANARDEDRQVLGLAAIGYIGGPAAVSVIRAEVQKNPADEFRAGLATVLATDDSPATRQELIRMLSEKRGDFRTIQAAALALGILRAPEGLPALRSVPRSTNRVQTQAAEIAIRWIERGYSSVAITPANDRGRAIAAVLRNGSPNLRDDDLVADEAGKGSWKFGITGWAFTQTELRDSRVEVTAFIGAEGSRALVILESHCGPRCGSGYHFVLRKDGQQWKVQMIIAAWVS